MTSLGRGRVFVNNTYGQTETGTAWTSAMIGLTPTKPGSCGHPLPGYTAEVLDEQGEPLPPGKLGYLTLTAPFPSLARTVWGDPERYQHTYFSQYPGHYFTADAALIDPDGQVWVTSRVDDVITAFPRGIGGVETVAVWCSVLSVPRAQSPGPAEKIPGWV